MKKNHAVNILFLMPAVLAFLVIVIIPFFMGIYYSLTDWNGVSSLISFVGFQNYTTMFKNPQFLFSFLITIAFTVINVLLVNLVSFALSLLVTSDLRMRNFYRAGFFIPNLIGGIVLGYIWQFIFGSVFKQLGIANMLSGQNSVIWAMSIVNTWQYAGYIMMIYVAAIQGIPESVMEAASVDGTNYRSRLFRIQIPMMANSFTITLFLTITNSFKQYDMNVTLTNGGPAGLFMKSPIQSSQLLAMNIYNTATKNNKYAEGQARAVVFFLILVLFSLVQVWFNKRREVEM